MVKSIEKKFTKSSKLCKVPLIFTLFGSMVGIFRFIFGKVMRLPGFMIGLAAGAVYFYVLSRFTAMVTGGTFTMRMALIGFLQFFIPLAVLVLCAFFLPNQLLWVGTGMAAALLGSAVIKFILVQRKKGRDKSDD